MMKARERLAFSQIELLVAVAVLAVGLLAVAGTLVCNLRLSRASTVHSQAANIDRRLIELVRTKVDFDSFSSIYATDLVDSGAARKPLDAPPFQAERFPREELRKFRRNIKVERVAAVPTDYRYNLWHIQVLISWDAGQVVYHAYSRQE